MRAVAADVLVSFLLKDDAERARKVYALFKQAEREGDRLFVPLLAVRDAIALLHGGHGVAESEILAALRDLLLLPVLVFEARPVLNDFILNPGGPAALADRLLLAAARAGQCRRVLTFDQAAAGHAGFELL